MVPSGHGVGSGNSRHRVGFVTAMMPVCAVLCKVACRRFFPRAGIKAGEGCGEAIAVSGASGAFSPVALKQEEKLLLAMLREPGWKRALGLSVAPGGPRCFGTGGAAPQGFA